MAYTLQDLGLAYRKAKVDLYYQTTPPLLAMAEYEEALLKNLKRLRDQLNSGREEWIVSPEFLGDWTLATKSIRWPSYGDDNDTIDIGLTFSAPSEKWGHRCALLERLGLEKPAAEFRVMARCSLDFHVLSALWMMKVGHRYDASLKRCAYGNRLRRLQSGGGPNALSLGSFVPYLRPFREWRDQGLRAIRLALDEGKKIVAITADVRSFYHELNPGFMAVPEFVDGFLGLGLSEGEEKLNRLFIRALEAWSANTPLRKGLPVGLPASAVVANLALIEFDRIIEQEVAPIYYGRYVDDILLVIENNADFRTSAEMWEWLFARANGQLAWVNKSKKTEISFRPPYLRTGQHRSNIHFANDKNKVFILAGDTGRTLLDAIEYQIRERASEWRAMPRVPNESAHVATDLVVATQHNGEAADTLRKTDALTLRRAAFAIKLRDLEAFERDLSPGVWQKERRAFLRAFAEHVLVLPQFFELAIYLPRVVQLATACEDFSELRAILDSVQALVDSVAKDCSIHLKAAAGPSSRGPVLKRWKEQIYATVCENIMAAFPPRLTEEGRRAWLDHMAHFRPPLVRSLRVRWPESSGDFQKQQVRLFSLDLAHLPFRFRALPPAMIDQRGIPSKGTGEECLEASRLLPRSVLNGIERLASAIALAPASNGLLFATRPFNLAEVFLLNTRIFSKEGREWLTAVALAVRGFEPRGKVPRIDKKGVLRISCPDSQPKLGIAVSSWKTDLDSWTAAVTRAPDPDIGRYARLNRLLDGLIEVPKQSSYFVLPELSLPARWFIRSARKLRGRGIALIAGIEYLHGGNRQVRNQVWAALPHNGFGFPSMMVLRQDKQKPALHEEEEIQRLGGLILKPEQPWARPPIIQHGDFRFSILICSELTNIAYRAVLRGHVDAIFVPEWNPDTETFNALVESAALDIHAYVIQCNDRQYGDSRIRAPYKDSWMRDLLRVKGGVTDYCVIGEIDVHALRQFQSSHRSPSKPFKPVPDGFEISPRRWVLPASDEE